MTTRLGAQGNRKIPAGAYHSGIEGAMVLRPTQDGAEDREQESRAARKVVAAIRGDQESKDETENDA